MSHMRIGQLAERVGVSADTIRYYERLGLLPRAARTTNGYRAYPERAVVRVQVVRNAVSFGFSLREVARFLQARDAGDVPCRQVRAAAQHLLDEMDVRIKRITATRRSLRQILRDWDARLQQTPAGVQARLLETLPVASPKTEKHPHRSNFMEHRRLKGFQAAGSRGACSDVGR